MNKNSVVVLIVLLVVAGVFWYSGIFDPFLIQKPVISNDDAEAGGIARSGGTAGFAKLGPDAIYIAEQQPGNILVVNIINLASPGYAVIHESKDGMPGTIIGVSPLIEDREGRNINVTLNRLAQDGEQFIAMLHTEKGVAGFDTATDLPVRDASGNIVGMTFQVSAGASDPSSVEVMF